MLKSERFVIVDEERVRFLYPEEVQLLAFKSLMVGGIEEVHFFEDFPPCCHVAGNNLGLIVLKGSALRLKSVWRHPMRRTVEELCCCGG